MIISARDFYNQKYKNWVNDFNKRLYEKYIQLNEVNNDNAMLEYFRDSISINYTFINDKTEFIKSNSIIISPPSNRILCCLRINIKHNDWK